MKTKLNNKWDYITLRIYLPEEDGPISLTLGRSGEKASGSKVRPETLKRVFEAFVQIFDAWKKAKAGDYGQFMKTLESAANGSNSTDELLAVLNQNYRQFGKVA